MVVNINLRNCSKICGLLFFISFKELLLTCGMFLPFSWSQCSMHSYLDFIKPDKKRGHVRGSGVRRVYCNYHHPITLWEEFLFLIAKGKKTAHSFRKKVGFGILLGFQVSQEAGTQPETIHIPLLMCGRSTVGNREVANCGLNFITCSGAAEISQHF